MFSIAWVKRLPVRVYNIQQRWTTLGLGIRFSSFRGSSRILAVLKSTLPNYILNCMVSLLNYKKGIITSTEIKLLLLFQNCFILGIYNKGQLVMPALVRLNKCFLDLLLCSVAVTSLHSTCTKLLPYANESCCSPSCTTAF